MICAQRLVSPCQDNADRESGPSAYSAIHLMGIAMIEGGPNPIHGFIDALTRPHTNSVQASLRDHFIARRVVLARQAHAPLLNKRFEQCIERRHERWIAMKFEGAFGFDLGYPVLFDVACHNA